jgi:hypothetical protein
MDERRAFDELRQTMIQHRLRWVVSEVEEEIRAGRTVEKLVRRGKRTPTGEEFEIRELPREMPGTSGKAELTTVPYTDSEQLAILIRAIRTVLVEGRALQQDLVIFVERATEAGQVMESRMVFEEEDDALRPAFAVPLNRDEGGRLASSRLAELLSPLEGELT